MRDRRTGSGFGLIEAIIALSLLGVALLLSASLLATLPREINRLEARREATRALGAVLESLRAGEIPATTGRVAPELYNWVQANPAAASDLLLWVTTEPTASPGRFNVRVRARYTVEHRQVERQIETEVWRP